MSSYDLPTLETMSLDELADAGKTLGLRFSKNVNKAMRRAKILLRQTEQAAAPTTEQPHLDVSSKRPPLSDASLPSFDRLTEPDEADAPRPDNRGGEREGAGRPEGMTDEKAAMNRLSQQPHPFFQFGLERLFKTWAQSVHCAEIALTKDEAFDLALVWTQVGDYYGVPDKIPPWLQLGIMAIWTTANIIASKAALARESRAVQEQAKQTEAPAEAQAVAA